MFFAQTQNKLLFAVTNQTAAEIISSRADKDAPNMGLTAFKGSVARKGDIIIARNYLSEDEIDTLNRLVVIFLETAELRVKSKKDITMEFWKQNVDKVLEFNDQKVLQGNGSISKAMMEEKVKEIYAEFDAKRKMQDAKDEDLRELEELQKLVGESRG